MSTVRKEIHTLSVADRLDATHQAIVAQLDQVDVPVVRQEDLVVTEVPPDRPQPLADVGMQSGVDGPRAAGAPAPRRREPLSW